MAIQRSNSFTLIVNTEDADHLAFAHSQEASISFTNSLVEATLGKTDGWTEYITGKKSSVISFSGLQDYGTITNRFNTDDLADFLIDSDLLYFQIGDGDDNEHGKGYISEITLEGGTDDVATYSGTFTVVDELDAARLVLDEKLQDSDGNDITDDAGDPITVKVFR